MASETLSPVTFPGTSGARLFGIVHEPLGGVRDDIAVVLLSPGVKNRVAPHRLYNKMSAVLAAQGFRVLRFDFYGLGDSEGDVNVELLADLYRSVQLGRYVEDTTLALDWMQRKYGCRRFLVGGLCGGALTGLLAGVNDPRVVGLFGLGIPVPSDGSQVAHEHHVTVGQLQWMRRGYLRKLVDPASWVRFLTFRTDYRMLVGSLLTPRRPKKAPPAAQPVPSGTASNANPLFAPALLGLLESRRPALLIFSATDRLTWEFEEKFRAPHAAAFSPYEKTLATVHEIRSANHVLTFSEWQAEAFAQLIRWLRTHFAAMGVSSTSHL